MGKKTKRKQDVPNATNKTILGLLVLAHVCSFSTAIPTRSSPTNDIRNDSDRTALPNEFKAYDNGTDVTGQRKQERLMKPVSRKTKNDKARVAISYEELIATVDQQIALHDSKIKACYMKNVGKFWSENTNSCEFCDSYCSEDNLTHCSLHCRDYFRAEKVKADVASLQSRINELEATSRQNLAVAIISSVTGLMAAIIAVIVSILEYKTRAKILKLENRLLTVNATSDSKQQIRHPEEQQPLNDVGQQE